MDNLDELVINVVTAQNGHKDYYAGRNIASEMQAIEDSLYGVAKGSEQMGKATEKGTQKVVRLRSEMKKTTTQAQLLSRAFRWIGGFFALNKLKDYADDWTQISSQIRLLTDTEEERVALQQKLFDISQNTRNATKETVDLYTKLTMNAQSLNLSQEKRLQLTELINKDLAAGSSDAEGNKRVLMQLGQALGVGRLQGQDLKSIQGTNLGFLQTIANGLGVDVSQLTEMGARGELTSERVLNAILSQQDEINKKFNKTSSTLKQSLGRLNNSVMKYIGDTDEALKITEKLSKAINLLADNINVVATTLTLLFLPRMLKAIPILGTFIKGSEKGYSALTIYRRGLVRAIPELLKFNGKLTSSRVALIAVTKALTSLWRALKFTFWVYGMTVFIKLLNQAFRAVQGKENIFTTAWSAAFDLIEERMGKLPDKFGDILEAMGMILSDWISSTKLGKIWDKFWGGIGDVFSETHGVKSMEERVRLMKLNDKTFGEQRFITPQQAQKFWAGQNITQNQDINITINEAKDGMASYNRIEQCLRQANANYTPYPLGGNK